MLTPGPGHGVQEDETGTESAAPEVASTVHVILCHSLYSFSIMTIEVSRIL